MFFKNRKNNNDAEVLVGDYDKAEPFMIRYYPLFRRRPKWFPFNIFIHKILKSDLGIFMIIIGLILQ